MKIYFRPRVTVICIILALGMVRMSFWQWSRHLQKQEFIAMMGARLRDPVLSVEELLGALDQGKLAELPYRQVRIKGSYDFDNEVVLRNRRYDDAPGTYVLTPLLLDGTDKRIIVNRGFIPLSRSARDKRGEYRGDPTAEFIGIVKASHEKGFFLAPSDPETGRDRPWVDAFLRIDLPRIGAQLPYPILPLHLEIMNAGSVPEAQGKIVTSKGGREDLLFLGGKETNVAKPDVNPDLVYPVPIFDTVIPPGRHLGYVYEWAGMAVLTILIGLVLQLRPERPR